MFDNVLGVLGVTLVADIKEFSAKMDEGIGKLEEFKVSSGGLGSMMSSMGPQIALAGIAAVGAIGVMSAELQMKFQHQLETLRTQAGASEEEVKRAYDAVLGIADQTGASTDQIVASLVQFEKFGIRGKTAFNLVNEAVKASITSGGDLQAVTGALIAAQSLHIKGTDDANKTLALFNAIISQGNLSLNDLTASLSGKALAALQGYGVDIKSTGAALDIFANAGLKGTAASMQLASMLGKLETPSKKTGDILKSIGLNQATVASDLRQPGGLVSTFQLLAAQAEKAGVKSQDLSAFFGQIFGAGRTGAGAQILLNNINAAVKAQDNLNKGVDTYNEKVKAAMSSPEQQIKILQQNIKDSLTRLGVVALPLEIKAIKFATKAIQDVEKFFTTTLVGGNSPKAPKTTPGSIVGDIFRGGLSTVGDIFGGVYHGDFSELSRGLSMGYEPINNIVKDITNSLASQNKKSNHTVTVKVK